MLKIPKQTVSDAMKRFQEHGHKEDRLSQGSKQTAISSRNCEVILNDIQHNSDISKTLQGMGSSHLEKSGKYKWIGKVMEIQHTSGKVRKFAISEKKPENVKISEKNFQS